MRCFATLARRELASFFFSWIGYAIIAAVAFLLGLSFVITMGSLRSEPTSLPVTEVFYDTAFFWLILLLAAPIITMRLFALEKFSGTFETLMTTPVSDRQVVLAKFTAALLFYLAMWAPLLASILIVRHFTTDPTALEPAAIGGTFLGIALVGGLFLSLGCFASALTRSQIIAAMTSFAGGMGLFVLSFLRDRAEVNTGWLAQAFYCLTLVEHMEDFARGVVDTRAVVFYLSFTAFFLFLTLRMVESRRWR